MSQTCHIHNSIPYIGNRSRKKMFTIFAISGAFANIFLLNCMCGMNRIFIFKKDCLTFANVFL